MSNRDAFFSYAPKDAPHLLDDGTFSEGDRLLATFELEVEPSGGTLIVGRTSPTGSPFYIGPVALSCATELLRKIVFPTTPGSVIRTQGGKLLMLSDGHAWRDSNGEAVGESLWHDDTTKILFDAGEAQP